MGQSYSDLREKLRSAISSGVLATTDPLDDIGVKIFGVKTSLDFVELVMALEERGVKLETVDDLMRFMDQVNVD
jgi:hypothetical protein